MVSRVLGMARDMITAYRFGASAVMDALVLALRIPDLFRRLFGEGVLGASLIPSFTALLEDRQRAWQFLSAALIATAAVPLALVLLGEGVCLLMWGRAAEAQQSQPALAATLTALLLPYVTLVCILAQLAAALQALGRFTSPALAPCILNLGWIAACVVMPWYSTDRPSQAKFLAVAVLISGVAQVAFLYWDLRRQGFRWQKVPRWAWSRLRGAAMILLPTAVAIAATQINTTIDGLTAWWLGDQGVIPVGAASAVYFGERLFMLPVGVVGISTAVVFFPTLCRFATQKQFDEIAKHVHQGLRGLWLLAIPASVGLVLLAEPVVSVLLERGEFGESAALRSARVAAAYGAGIWIFAALPLLVRVELATGNVRRAAIAGLVAVAIHSAPIVLVGRWGGEMALAAATTLASLVQAALLWLGIRQQVPLRWSEMAPSLFRILTSAALMGGFVWWARPWVAAAEQSGSAAMGVRLLGVVFVAAMLHLSLERLLRRVPWRVVGRS